MFPRFEAWNNMTKNGDNIVIVSHPTPDGDALGSAFALAQALDAAGKKPVLLLDKFSDKFNFLKGQEYIHTGDGSDLLCDVLIAVDCGEKSRMGVAEELFARTPITINIDHHINNKNFARFNYIDPNCSSTCEVIFNIVNMYIPISKNMAEALYTGILTDTGGFRHANTSAETMEIVAMLMRVGIDVGDIQRRTMYAHSKAETAIFATALQNTKYVDGHCITYSTISQAELAAAGAEYKDLDGIAEYLLNTEDTCASVLFTQRKDGKTKASFRSVTADVAEVAGKFAGGGHKFAAAAVVEADLETAVNQVLDALKATAGTC